MITQYWTIDMADIIGRDDAATLKSVLRLFNISRADVFKIITELIDLYNLQFKSNHCSTINELVDVIGTDVTTKLVDSSLDVEAIPEDRVGVFYENRELFFYCIKKCVERLYQFIPVDFIELRFINIISDLVIFIEVRCLDESNDHLYFT